MFGLSFRETACESRCQQAAPRFLLWETHLGVTHDTSFQSVAETPQRKQIPCSLYPPPEKAQSLAKACCLHPKAPPSFWKGTVIREGLAVSTLRLRPPASNAQSLAHILHEAQQHYIIRCKVSGQLQDPHPTAWKTPPPLCKHFFRLESSTVISMPCPLIQGIQQNLLSIK